MFEIGGFAFWIDDLMLPVALAIAGVTGWTDLKPMLPHLMGRVPYERSPSGGKISNRVLLLGLALGLIWHLFAWAWHSGGYGLYSFEMLQAKSMPYWFHVALNATISFGLGFLLWTLGLWAAGDGKLFGVLAFLLPLAVYRNNYLNWFPSFVLFFNTFIGVFVILVVEFAGRLVFMVKEGGPGYLGKTMERAVKSFSENKIKVLKIIILFLAIFTIIRLARHFLRVVLDMGFGEINKTMVYVILFMVFKPLTRLLQYKPTFWVALSIVVGYMGWAFFFDPTGEAKYHLVDIGALALSIIIFRFAYDAYLKATDERRIPVQDLRAKMVLSEETVRKFKERREFYRRWLKPLEPDGLRPRQVKAIRGWYEENDTDGTVGIARTLPFAPALFFGTIITIVVRGLLLVF
jgi:hypothetical protein